MRTNAPLKILNFDIHFSKPSNRKSRPHPSITGLAAMLLYRLRDVHQEINIYCQRRVARRAAEYEIQISVLAGHFALYFGQALPAPILSADKVIIYAAHRIAASPGHELFFLEITMKRIMYAGLVVLVAASFGYAAPESTISARSQARMALPSGGICTRSKCEGPR